MIPPGLRPASACLLAALAVSGAFAADITPPAFSAEAALQASQAAIGRQLTDLALTDMNGQRISLGDLRGRPLVISPVYTSCYHVCPVTTTYLKGVSDVANAMLGESSYTILTVGFDAANDTPERMRDYAKSRGVDSAQWVFASADPATVTRLMNEIGFTYAPAAGGFDHMVQATVVDGEGRIYRQVYGQQFDAPMLVDALKQIVMGQRAQESSLPSLIDRVRLICTVFDPKTGRYRFDYSLVVAFVVGILCLGSIAIFIWRSWRQMASADRAA
jgi:protein SCO1/2